MVVLLNDQDVYGLKSGDVGTVVHCYQDKKGFEVEFVTAAGQTINVLTLTDAGIRPFAQSEIFHTREFKSFRLKSENKISENELKETIETLLR